MGLAYLDVVAYCLYALIRGSVYLFLAGASRSFPPITVAALRCALPWFPVISSYVGRVFFQSKVRVDTKDYLTDRSTYWKSPTFSFFATIISFICSSWGSTILKSGTCSILVALVPLLTMLFAHSPLFSTKGHPLIGKEYAALALGFIGVMLTCCESLMNGGARSNKYSQGTVLLAYSAVLFSCCCWAIAGLLGEMFFVDRYNPHFVISGDSTFGGSVLILLALMFEYDDPPAGYGKHFSFYETATTASWIYIILLGAVSYVLSAVVILFLLDRIGPIRLQTTLYAVPIVGICLGYIVLGENEEMSVEAIVFQWLGAFFTISACVLLVHTGKSRETKKMFSRQRSISSEHEEPFLEGSGNYELLEGEKVEDSGV